MNIIIKNIESAIDSDINSVYEKALKKVNLTKDDVHNMYVHKKSIDARKHNIKFVYSICVSLNENVKINKTNDISYKENYELDIKHGKAPMESKPIIVGFGPAGLFCAYILSKYGYNPIVIEQGKTVEERTKDVDLFFKMKIFNEKSNIQFGEGGAGTFSDGKLTTRINDKRCEYVLKTFNEFGADDKILYEAHPHIGTDHLKKIIVNMRNEIIKSGGTILFNTKVDDLIIKDNNVKGIITDDNEKIYSENVVLAIGHSSRHTYEMLRKYGIFMEKKAFSVGFRIEHKREFIDRGRYGRFYGNKNLEPAEYQFSYRKNNRGCYTFCMCPGGTVIASNSEENMVVTNGMSENKRDFDNSNSAVVASVLPEDFDNDIFSGIEFQRELEKKAFELGGKSYRAPSQLSRDFMNNIKSDKFLSVKPSYPIGTENCNFNDVFPKRINDILLEGLGSFESKLKGFSYGDGVLTGIETRTSSPVRITRNEEFNSISVKGLYPAGEGAGYAGGITSAAVDGIKIAEKIISIYKPFE